MKHSRCSQALGHRIVGKCVDANAQQMHWQAIQVCIAVLQEGHANSPLQHVADAAPQHASLDMDLSCSESGDDLASSCLSPSCASNHSFQRELSPPIGVEVCVHKAECPAASGAFQ